jgi:GNAT superfamily N-acetyltransferase
MAFIELRSNLHVVPFVIRAARLEDAESVVEVHERASDALFLDTVGRRLADALPLEARLEDCRGRLAAAGDTAGTLVAESGGRVVGMASWSRVDDGQGELEDLHVLPEAWGTGVAVDLLEAAVEALREAGVEKAFLWVGEANVRARRFYEREGWAYDGTSRPSTFGPTELRYRLALSSDLSST